MGATLIVHPRTERTHPYAVQEALAELRHGTIGVNTWSGVTSCRLHPVGRLPGPHLAGDRQRHPASSTTPSCSRTSKTGLRAPFAPAPRGLFTGCPSLTPKPPYFVTHRTGPTTLEHLTHFTAAPPPVRLPAVLAAACAGDQEVYRHSSIARHSPNQRTREQGTAGVDTPESVSTRLVQERGAGQRAGDRADDRR
ncbi:hypothetical protein [Streptomyces sp. NPDC007905]|uniref:hypothetical protein n=1 Tax=Streptomyces sp. NPDC007905 TaxID=3364788 RepID=UPI0036EF4C90